LDFGRKKINILEGYIYKKHSYKGAIPSYIQFRRIFLKYKPDQKA
jgi:hypothetical protein